MQENKKLAMARIVGPTTMKPTMVTYIISRTITPKASSGHAVVGWAMKKAVVSAPTLKRAPDQQKSRESFSI